MTKWITYGGPGTMVLFVRAVTKNEVIWRESDPKRLVNSAGQNPGEAVDEICTPGSTDERLALAYRAAWMRLLGCSEDEIARACGPEGPPADVDEERQELEAAQAVVSRGITHAEAATWSNDYWTTPAKPGH